MRGGWGRQDYGQRGHTTIHSVALRSPFPGLGRLAVTAESQMCLAPSQMCLAPLLAAPACTAAGSTTAGTTAGFSQMCLAPLLAAGTAAGCCFVLQFNSKGWLVLTSTRLRFFTLRRSPISRAICHVVCTRRARGKALRLSFLPRVFYAKK